MHRWGVFVFILLLSLGGSGWAMDKAFSWTMAPGSGDNITANLAAFQLSKYLQECQVNRPEIVAEVKGQLEKGEYYRKRTRDEKNRGTLLTVYVDNDMILHIITYRSETCPDCEGTGVRAKPFEKVTGKISLQLKCLKCNGEGTIPNYTNERYFTLSPEDFEDTVTARALFAEKAYAHAPTGAEEWVERLASKDPRERLAACEWLDQHYVKEGMFFQDLLPMLKKARFHEANEKKRMLVWQFWAGKDLPDERKRAYYRVYAESKDGKVVKKGFFPAK